MASKSMAHGMGTFYKDCEHGPSRWSRCPHEYKIRYRSAAGRQTEEEGFIVADAAVGRLTDVYNAKKTAPQSRSRARRIRKYGAMQFGEYAAEWKAGQRHWPHSSTGTSGIPPGTSPLACSTSCRMDTFDHKVVDGFIERWSGTELDWRRSPTPTTSSSQSFSMPTDSASTAKIPSTGSKLPSTPRSAPSTPVGFAASSHTDGRRREDLPLPGRPHERLRDAQR